MSGRRGSWQAGMSQVSVARQLSPGVGGRRPSWSGGMQQVSITGSPSPPGQQQSVREMLASESPGGASSGRRKKKSKRRASRSAENGDDGDALPEQSTADDLWVGGKKWREYRLIDFLHDWHQNSSFANKSLMIFGPTHPIRIFMISLTHAREFSAISFLLIIGNCIAMLMYDPLEPVNSAYNQGLERVELIFTICFTVESLCCIIATGLFMPDLTEGQLVRVYFLGSLPSDTSDVFVDERTGGIVKQVILQPPYLKTNWNRLDLLVVIASWAAWLATQVIGIEGTSGVSGLAALRLLRLLKPLRTLKMLPGLNMLINVLFAIAEQEFAVFFITFMIILYFTAPLLLLWTNTMTGRCMPLPSIDSPQMPPSAPTPAAPPPPLLPDGTYNNSSPYYDESVRLCDLAPAVPGFLNGRVCPAGMECVDTGLAPGYGYTSFDNLGTALFLLTQCVTLDRWSTVASQLSDANGNWAILPIIALLVLASFGVLLLSLLVIVAKMSQVLQAEEREIKRQKENKHLIVSYTRSTVSDEKEPQGVSWLIEQLRERSRLYPLLAPQRTSWRWLVYRFVSYPRKSFPNARALVAKHEVKDELPKEMEEAKNSVSYFESFMLFVIITNTVVLALNWPSMPKELRAAFDDANVAFTLIFAVEVTLKIVAFGFISFSAIGFNVFDLVVVLASTPELICAFSTDESSGASIVLAAAAAVAAAEEEGGGACAGNFTFLRTLRLLRLLRSFRVLYKSQNVRLLVRGLQAGARETMSFLLLFMLILFVVAMAGMQLFGGRMLLPEGQGGVTAVSPSEAVPRSHFDNFGAALISSLQLITGSAWTTLCLDAMKSNGIAAALFFVPVVLVGKYVIMNVFIAILISKLPDLNYLDREEMSRRRMQRLKEFAQTEQMSNPLADGKLTTMFAVRRCAKHWLQLTRRRKARRFLLFRIRDACRKILRYKAAALPSLSFANFINFCVVLSLVNVSVMTEEKNIPKDVVESLTIADITLTSIFTLELGMHLFDLGPKRWARTAWCVIDAVILVLTYVSYLPLGSNNLTAAQGLRALRVGRILRTIRRIPGLRSAINTVVNALPATLGVACLCLFAWLTLAIFAVDLLQGRLLVCSEPSVALGDCTTEAGLSQVPAPYNFDHIGSALLTLFSISQLDRWSYETWRGMGAVSDGDRPQVAAFFIVFMLFGSILMTGLFSAVLVNEYQRNHYALLTQEQLQWVEAKKVEADIKMQHQDAKRVKDEKKKERLLKKNAKRDSQKNLLAAKAESEKALQTDGAEGGGGSGSGSGGLGGKLQRLVGAPLKQAWREVKAYLRETNIGREYPPSLREKKVKQFLKQEMGIDGGRRGLEGAPSDANEQDLELRNRSTFVWVQDVCWKFVRGQPKHQITDTFIVVLLTLNLILGGSVHLGQGNQITTWQSMINGLTAIFWIIELGLRLMAYGPLAFLSSFADAVDGLFAVWAIVGVFIGLTLTPFTDDFSYVFALSEPKTSFADWRLKLLLARAPSLIGAYRIPRLLMTWRYLRRPLKPYRALLHTLVLALPAIKNVYLLGILVQGTYAVLGTYLFNEVTPPPSYPPSNLTDANREHNGISDRYNFNHLGMSLITLVRVLTGDQWGLLLEDCMRQTDATIAIIYFVTLVIFNFLLINLLNAAFLLGGFRALYHEGLLVPATHTLALLEAKRRLLVPVYLLRKRRRHASSLHALMHEEKEGFCSPVMMRLLKAVPSRLTKERETDVALKTEVVEKTRAILDELEHPTAELAKELPELADRVHSHVHSLLLHATWRACKCREVDTLQDQRPRALARVRAILLAAPELITSDPPPRWPISGDTPLMVAAFNGDSELTNLLISIGPSVRHRNLRTPAPLLKQGPPMLSRAFGSSGASSSMSSSLNGAAGAVSADSISERGGGGDGTSREGSCSSAASESEAAAGAKAGAPPSSSFVNKTAKKHEEREARMKRREERQRHEDLKEIVARNTALHYAILGAASDKETWQRRHERQNTLEMLLWPRAFRFVGAELLSASDSPKGGGGGGGGGGRGGQGPHQDEAAAAMQHALHGAELLSGLTELKTGRESARRISIFHDGDDEPVLVTRQPSDSRQTDDEAPPSCHPHRVASEIRAGSPFAASTPVDSQREWLAKQEAAIMPAATPAATPAAGPAAAAAGPAAAAARRLGGGGGGGGTPVRKSRPFWEIQQEKEEKKRRKEEAEAGAAGSGAAAGAAAGSTWAAGLSATPGSSPRPPRQFKRVGSRDFSHCPRREASLDLTSASTLPAPSFDDEDEMMMEGPLAPMSADISITFSAATMAAISSGRPAAIAPPFPAPPRVPPSPPGPGEQGGGAQGVFADLGSSSQESSVNTPAATPEPSARVPLIRRSSSLPERASIKGVLRSAAAPAPSTAWGPPSFAVRFEEVGEAPAPAAASMPGPPLLSKRSSRFISDQLGVDPAAPNAKGDCPLHIAARMGTVAPMKLLLDWDEFELENLSKEEAQKGGEGVAEGSEETFSLVNMHNLHNGRTPLIEALRSINTILRRKEADRTPNDEKDLSNLLQTAQLLMMSHNIDPLGCALEFSIEVPPRKLLDGGISPLLLIVSALGLVERALSSEHQGDSVTWKEALHETRTQLLELELSIVSYCTEKGQVERLRQQLHEEHDTFSFANTVGTTGRTTLLGLVLSTGRSEFIMSAGVQEAIARSWHLSSRYRFFAAAASFTVCALCITAVGYLSVVPGGIAADVAGAVLPDGETVGSVGGLWGWLEQTVVPGALSGGTARPWFVMDAMRLERVQLDATPWCQLNGDALKFIDRAANECSSLSILGTAGASLPNTVDVVMTDVASAAARLQELASQQWVDPATAKVSFALNLLHIGGYLCRVHVQMELDGAGSFKMVGSPTTQVNVVRLWREGDYALLTFTGLSCVGMLVWSVHGVMELCELGLGGFRNSWRAVDLAHNILFLVIVTTTLFRYSLAPSPRNIVRDFNGAVSYFDHNDFSSFVVSQRAFLDMLALFIVLTYLRMLKYLRAIRHIGILVEILLGILHEGSASALFVLFGTFLIGWSAAAYVVFGGSSPGLPGIGDALFIALNAMTGDISDSDLLIQTPVGYLLYLFALVIFAVLLLNVLIAILSKSYTDITQEASQAFLMLQANLTHTFYLKVEHGQTNAQQQQQQAQKQAGLETAESSRRSSNDHGAAAGGSPGGTSPHRRLQKNTTAKNLAARAKMRTAKKKKVVGKKALPPGQQPGHRVTTRREYLLYHKGTYENLLRISMHGESRQLLRAIKADSMPGLQSLRDIFLPQLHLPCFGRANGKLRYLRQVFSQCGEDIDNACDWLSEFGLQMLTPATERLMAEVQIQFPVTPRAKALALLEVLSSATEAAKYLRGQRVLSPYEQMELEALESKTIERLALPPLKRPPRRAAKKEDDEHEVITDSEDDDEGGAAEAEDSERSASTPKSNPSPVEKALRPRPLQRGAKPQPIGEMGAEATQGGGAGGGGGGSDTSPSSSFNKKKRSTSVLQVAGVGNAITSAIGAGARSISRRVKGSADPAVSTEEAALSIEKMFRGFSSRRATFRSKAPSSASPTKTVSSSSFSGSIGDAVTVPFVKARQWSRNTAEHATSAAVRIQRTWRRKAFRILRHKHRSAGKIQALFRKKKRKAQPPPAVSAESVPESVWAWVSGGLASRQESSTSLR